MNTKTKIILISVIVVLFVVGGYLVWSSFSGNGGNQPADNKDNGGDLPVEGSLPPSEKLPLDPGKEESEVIKAGDRELQLKKISDSDINVFSFWLNDNDGEIVYITDGGDIRKAKIGPDIEVASESNITAINKVQRSESSEMVLVSFGDPKKPNWGVFDMVDTVWRPLPSVIDKAIWGEGKKLIAVIDEGSGPFLASFDVENVTSEKPLDYDVLVSDFRFRDVNLKWIDSGGIIIQEKTASFYKPRTWFLNLENSSISLVSEGGAGTLGYWYRNDDLVIQTDPEKEVSVITDREMNAVTSLPPRTLPFKCGPDREKNIMYCFSPRGFSGEDIEAGFTQNYLQKKIFTVDRLIEVDLSGGDFEEIIKSGTDDMPPLDAKGVIYNDRALYFINRYDKGLYRLNI